MGGKKNGGLGGLPDYNVFAAGWYSGHTYEQKSDPCNRNEDTNCGADLELSRHKPCGGCRTRIYCASACGTTLEYTAGKKGNPCVQADTQIYGENTGGQTGFMCVYRSSKINSEFLKNLSDDPIATVAGIKDGPTVYDQLLIGTQVPNRHNATSVGKGFCEQVDNVATVIHKNGDTCYRYLAKKVNETTAKQKAIDFCKANPNQIKTELCVRENLGKDEYERLAGQYCDTEEGGQDDWCSCYNAYKGKCLKSTSLAGCQGVKAQHDELLKDIPDDQLTGTVRQQFEERMHCRNNVCKTTDAFKPEGSDKCEMNLQLCIQDVKVAGHLVESGISVVCNNKQETGGAGGGGTDVTKDDSYDETTGSGGGSGSGSGSGSGKSSKGGFELTKTSGIAGGVASSMFSMCCVILLIASMSE